MSLLAKTVSQSVEFWVGFNIEEFVQAYIPEGEIITFNYL